MAIEIDMPGSAPNTSPMRSPGTTQIHASHEEERICTELMKACRSIIAPALSGDACRSRASWGQARSENGRGHREGHESPQRIDDEQGHPERKENEAER